MGRFMTLVAWSTVLALAGCARTNHAERLIADLRSADPAVRLNAAGELRELRDPKALEPLIAALEDEDAAVRFQSAAALGEFGDPRAVEPLIGALKDRDKDVRWAATFALRDLGPSAVGSLTNALRHSQPGVRMSAAAALREIRDAKAVGPLVALLEDPDPTVRGMAASALAGIGEPAAERLTPALRTGDFAEVARAYRFFIAWAEPGSEDILIEALDARGSEEMAEAFLNCGNPKLRQAAERWARAHGYQEATLWHTAGSATGWGSAR